MIRTSVLGEAVGIQWSGLTDKTETNSQTGLGYPLLIGQFKRGRTDKPMTVTSGNIKALLGYEPTNKDYIAVQDYLDTKVPSVQVLRIGKSITQIAYPENAMVLISSDQVNEVTLSLNKGTYNIDWGDDSADIEVSGDIPHTYITKAKHTIIVKKASNEGGTNDNNTMVMTQAFGIQEVAQWYDQGYEALGFALNQTNLQNTLLKVPSKEPLVFATQRNPIFMFCSVFNDPNVLQWDVSSYTDLSQWFYECHAFNQPIGKTWDFSNKTDLGSMFYNCSSFNQEMGMINVNNVSYLKRMFYGCTKFNQDLSQWCVSKIDAREMGNVNSSSDLFAYDSALAPEHYPVWGTCPRGENITA